MKWFRRILRRRNTAPVLTPVTPEPTASRFYDGFQGGLDLWQFETGVSFNGDQDYTTNNYTIGTDGIHMTATPDRRSIRLISRDAPFGRGTRLSYLASLDPAQEAIWPALWAIGKSTAWPKCGEVDVMECGLGGQWKVKQTIHTIDTYAKYGEYGLGPNGVDVPDGMALYTAEWVGKEVRFAVNGIQAGVVPYSAEEPLRLVMNVALRKNTILARSWRMTVREVAVEPIA